MSLLIRNASVWTVDASTPRAEAVGIDGGRIVAVGSDREVRSAVGPGADGPAAAGATPLPGFIDAHNHLRLGSDIDAVQLASASTLDEVRSTIDGFASANPDRDWIVGEAWNYAALPDRRRPRADDLDGAASDRAVMVFSYDVH